MSLIKNAAKKERTQRTVSVNSNDELLAKFSKWDGKTLVDIDATTQLASITLGKKDWEGGTITNLVIGFPKGDRIAFPLSRGFAQVVEDDEDALLDGEFYYSKKMVEGDEEGAPTGDPYISFGKPSGLQFDTEKDMVNAEPVEKED